MKKLITLGSVLVLLLLASTAWASKEQLASQLVERLYGDQSLSPTGRGKDPVARDAYFRKVAVGFFRDGFTEVELKDLVGFFSSPAGRRLVRSREKIENEVFSIAFLVDMNATVPVNPSAPPADDPRRKLAAELMKAPSFAATIKERARQYDTARGGWVENVEVASPESVEYIRNLYVERYARRFSEQMLTDIVSFYRSKLGTKYSKSEIELPKVLAKATETFDQ